MASLTENILPLINGLFSFGKALAEPSSLWVSIPVGIAVLVSTFFPKRPRGLQVFSGTVVVFTAIASARAVMGERGIVELAYNVHHFLAILIMALLGLVLIFTSHPIGGLGWWVSDPLVVGSLTLSLLGMILSKAPLPLGWLVAIGAWLSLVAVLGFIHWIISQIYHSAEKSAEEKKEEKALKQALAAYETKKEEAVPEKKAKEAFEVEQEFVKPKAAKRKKGKEKRRKKL